MYLRTRTPQGDGNVCGRFVFQLTVSYLRTRTPQGDGNNLFLVLTVSFGEFKNQNPARGRKQ